MTTVYRKKQRGRSALDKINMFGYCTDSGAVIAGTRPTAAGWLNSYQSAACLI
jgi:hypothetical protein